MRNSIQKMPSLGVQKLETLVYFVMWCGIFLYSMRRVYEDGEYLLKQNALEKNDFAPGWRIFGGRSRDVSDYEWAIWTSLTFKLLPWLLFHVFLCETIRNYDVEAVPLVHFLTSMLALVMNFTIFTPLMVIFQFSIFFLALCTKSKFVVWFLGIALMFFIDYFKFVLKDFFFMAYDELTLVTTCFAWFHIRCIDFTITEINSSSRPLMKFMDFLGYVFYLPCFFLGPFIPYDSFKTGLYSTYKPWTYTRLNNLLRSMFFIAVWYCVYEGFSHYLYCHSMHYQVDRILPLGVWTVNGVGLCMAQFFFVKYVVIYGLSIAVAKAEGYDAPPSPKCINRIHLYSEMWRHFDRGFYLFMLRCIYQPVCNSQTPKFGRKLFATFLCFCFVFLWHGINLTVFIWSVLNFVGLSFEALGKALRNTEAYRVLEGKILSEANMRRLKAAICSPLWLMAVVSNFVFFGGHELGLVYINQVIKGNFTLLSGLFLVGYCMCQVSMEASLVINRHKNPNRKD